MRLIRRVAFALVMLWAITTAACTPAAMSHPPAVGTRRVVRATSAPQQIPPPVSEAKRLLPQAVEMIRGATPSLTNALLAASKVATPEPVITGYVGGALPVSWVLDHDKAALRGDLFAAMRPAPESTSMFIVPVLANGERIFDFQMERSGTDWKMVGTSDPPDLHGDLVRRQLGPGTEIRRALFLPSGLIFDVGKNGTRQALQMAAFFNHGPGITGFDGELPWDRVLTRGQLLQLLGDERTRPYDPAPGTYD